jgi:hypothetical protein
MKTKKQFSTQLNSIREAYKEYLEDHLDYIGQESIPDLCARFAELLNLVSDLYYGSVCQQKTATELLQSLDLNKVGGKLCLPVKALQKLIYEPEAYAESISYSRIKNEEEQEPWI